jgi:hypothetical protein
MHEDPTKITITASRTVVIHDGRTLLEVGGADGLPFPARAEDGAILFETTLPATGSGLGAIARIRLRLDAMRHLWIPHVSPFPDSVIGDHSLRSPAMIFADEATALALIPDADDLRYALESGYRIWLDYDHPERAITVCAGSYETAHFHVAYRRIPLAYHGQKARLRLHIVASSDPAALDNPYGMAARWIWDRWGRAGLRDGGSQRAPFSRYQAHVANWAFEPEPRGWGDTVWQEFDLGGARCGAPAFIVDVAQHPSIPVEQRRWREQRSVWNQAWFSTQRSANGLLRYARQAGRRDLEERARLMTRVALCAPQTDGLFPSVYTAGGGEYCLYKDAAGWDQARWTNSDRRPRAASADAVHILDASFTARLLLEWHGLNPGETEALEYVRRYVGRLTSLQRADGSFPGWVEPDGAVPEELAAGPETAMSVTLLLELASLPAAQADGARANTGRTAAARAGLDYLERGPIRESRWEDFETYYSCSQWGADRVGRKIERNGVYKSNTFSPFWCAEAFLAAYRLFGDQRLLAAGRRCLDELSLYQQVWQPPVLPVPTHGGFGVMNADAEWNDARQSLFAPLYLEYYGATGDPECFERGVSALRASFAMMYCPENAHVKAAYERQHPSFGPESYGFMMENVAHGGPGHDPIGPFTIYTWGNGAALEAAAKVRDLFGDVYVDAARGRAFGIDGCTVTGDEVVDAYGRGELLVVRSDGARETLRLVNGRGRLPRG